MGVSFDGVTVRNVVLLFSTFAVCMMSAIFYSSLQSGNHAQQTWSLSQEQYLKLDFNNENADIHILEPNFPPKKIKHKTLN